MKLTLQISWQNNLVWHSPARRSVCVAVMLVAAMFVAGCSQDVRRIVSADFRDKSGSYDGDWLAFMAQTPSPQIIQNWKVKCNSFEQSIPISVEEGVVTTRINDVDHSTYISGNGRFRLEIPTGLKMSNPISSSATLIDGRVTLILQGDLGRDKPSGSFTFGIADFANVGCTTRVNYIPTELTEEGAEDEEANEGEVVDEEESIEEDEPVEEKAPIKRTTNPTDKEEVV